MDFISYVDYVVHITLVGGYYYLGKVVSADKDGLSLIDKNGKKVSISNKTILTIREVNDG